MRSFIPALLIAWLALSPMASADDAAQKKETDAQADQLGCGIVSDPLVAQGQGHVMIDCAGVTEAYGGQLAGILTYVLQRRLDPEIVIAKLDEVEGVPAGDQPRNLTADQGQALVQALVSGKPSAIKIVADPDGTEPGNYALAIATRLGMANWVIEDNQIPRTVPPGLDDIHGMVLVVHDEKTPPEKAQVLKKAMAAAKIFVPMISRADIAPGAVMLWIGKRPTLNAATTQ